MKVSDKRTPSSDLEADLRSVFEKHGWEAEEAGKLAADSAELANGAVLAYMVPVVGTADCTI